jgi:hypothetical protein
MLVTTTHCRNQRRKPPECRDIPDSCQQGWKEEGKGGVLAALVGDQQAKSLQEQLDHGGLLVWVRTPSPADEQKAVDFLNRNDASDVHVHSIKV